MQGIGITIDSNVTDLIKKLGDAKLTRFGVLLRQIGEIYLKHEKALFANKSGRKGAKESPWADLKASYKEIKRKRWGKVYPTLVAGGSLAESFSKEGAPHNVFVLGQDYARFGSTHPLARYHQDGHSRGVYPARPMVYESASLNARINKKISFFYTRLLKDAGLAVNGNMTDDGTKGVFEG